MTPMSNEQQTRLDGLRARYATAADAAREYDCLADMVENRGRTYSEEANVDAVALLRLRRDQARQAADKARDALHSAEGFLSCRA